MSKNIGIKLADGTFYPILADGTPDKKVLNLTTVKDNQTTVQVDLYRSETNSMDDAEYVDTLQIDNLIAHPNGEPTIDLNISLDENNKLSAEISDPESGEHSDISVTLVSRTQEERNEPVNYDIADSEKTDAPVKHTGGLLAAAEAKRAAEEAEKAIKQEDPLSSSLDDLPDMDDTISQEKPVVADDFSIEDDTIAEEEDIEPSIESEPVSFEEDKVDLDEIPDTFDAPEQSEPAEQKDGSDLNDLNDLDFDMPQLDTEISSVPIDFDIPEDAAVEEPAAQDTIATPQPEATPTSDLNEIDFDMPDFDSSDNGTNIDLPSFDDSDDTLAAKDPLEDINFDMPDFGDTSTDSFDMSEDTATAPTGSGLDFSDLYDDETVEGLSSAEQDSKITRKHVIICVICAIICIIATILILFVVPSPVNLIASRNTKDSKATTQVAEAPQQTEPPVVVQPIAPETQKTPAKPVVPEAKENEIVISPTPTIVPQAPKPKQTEQANIRYKIKWGDTLWDISEAYYKNPWKYTNIAKYNHIKNPDYIISGTYITIPAQ
ncbi:MAG: LysM peptidoglycan-binding domain-containing protein [Treponema sp.]|nr:LysM peptidoglycan-binding domain-containing protein [Treponema sp.]